MNDHTRDLQAEFQAIHEFIPAARARIDDNAWGYLIGGTETETTVARNRAALDSIAIRPRVLVDVSEIDTTADFLGHRVRLPICLAPVGGLEAFHADGALAVAQGAGDFGVPAMISSVSSYEKQQFRDRTDAPALFQLYVRGDGRFVEEQIEEAIAADMEAFCITVDSAVYSRRERDIVQRFDKPWRRDVNPDAVRTQAAFNWSDVARVRKAHDLPLILKGIMTADDARIAADHGVDVIYISNHGGRQLDHGQGTMDVLPEIAAAVGGRCKIMIDGGFCRGSDIIKALALGAHSVGIGRLFCYGLATAGAAGIVRLLEILEDEIHSGLGLTGVTNYGDLSADHLHLNAPPVSRPSVFSAFPLLTL